MCQGLERRVTRAKGVPRIAKQRQGSEKIAKAV